MPLMLRPNSTFNYIYYDHNDIILLGALRIAPLLFRSANTTPDADFSEAIT